MTEQIFDHRTTERLAAFEAQCAVRGAKLTKLRRKVLELLLRRDAPVKAYDLQEEMRSDNKRIAPTTIYRALDFLIEQGFAHRINALNAFVACCDAQSKNDMHEPLMLVCSACEKSAEINDPAVWESINNSLRRSGTAFHSGAIEIQGLCATCLKEEKSAPSG